MKQYCLNPLAYHTLPTVLKETQKDMARNIGLSLVTMQRHLQDGDFKVSDAIAICNHYRIPMSVFVSIDDLPSFRGITPTQKDEWTECSFDSSKTQARIDIRQTSYLQMTRATGFARRTLDTILDGRSQMSQLLEYCNKMCYNLSDFIKGCPTLPCIINETSDIKAQNIRLRAENAQLRQQIAELKRMLSEEKERRTESETIYQVAEQ